MTMILSLRGSARRLQRVRAVVPGVVLTVAVAVAASGLVWSRASAQDIPIPMVSIPKAAANRAAAATNAHTNAMQAVGDETPAASGSAPSAHPMAPVRTTTSTPITASAPAKPHVQASKSAKTTATPAVNPMVSVGSSPGPATVSVTPAGAKAATPAPAKGAKGVAVAAAAGAKAAAAPAAAGPDTGATSISVTQRGIRGEVSLNREVYSYDPGARRDPFVSLMRSGDLRPLLSDLRLVTVLYDPTGRNSIAVMHDLSTKDQYRVRVGQTLGRMRVAQIQPKHVVFTIEEVGFSRQEALALGDTTKARTQ